MFSFLSLALGLILSLSTAQAQATNASGVDWVRQVDGFTDDAWVQEVDINGFKAWVSPGSVGATGRDVLDVVYTPGFADWIEGRVNPEARSLSWAPDDFVEFALASAAGAQFQTQNRHLVERYRGANMPDPPGFFQVSLCGGQAPCFYPSIFRVTDLDEVPASLLIQSLEADSDADGITDAEDDCDDAVGPLSNNGCPEDFDEPDDPPDDYPDLPYQALPDVADTEDLDEPSRPPAKFVVLPFLQWFWDHKEFSLGYYGAVWGSPESHPTFKGNQHGPRAELLVWTNSGWQFRGYFLWAYDIYMPEDEEVSMGGGGALGYAFTSKWSLWMGGSYLAQGAAMWPEGYMVINNHTGVTAGLEYQPWQHWSVEANFTAAYTLNGELNHSTVYPSWVVKFWF